MALRTRCDADTSLISLTGSKVSRSTCPGTVALKTWDCCLAFFERLILSHFDAMLLQPFWIARLRPQAGSTFWDTK